MTTDEKSLIHDLKHSVTEWKKQGLKAAWLKVPKSKANFVPLLCGVPEISVHSASSQGFVFSYWLRGKEEKNTLPSYAHTTVGIGAFVHRKDTDEVLTVMERHGPAGVDKAALWKIPGGAVDPSESVVSAAEREVLEETGVRARFQSLVAFREAHNDAGSRQPNPWSLLGSTNFYCVAVLAPLEPNAPLVPQAEEIHAAKWMKREELLSQPQYPPGSVYHAMLLSASESVTDRPNGFIARDLPSPFGATQKVFFNLSPSKL